MVRTKIPGLMVGLGLVPLALVGCSDFGGLGELSRYRFTEEADAAPDARPDSEADAGNGTPGTPDAATEDAGADATVGVDAGSDASTSESDTDATATDAAPDATVPTDATTDATVPTDAARDATTSVDAMADSDRPDVCVPETDGAFCARTRAVCGAKTALDNCGSTRTVPNCGSCTTGTCVNNACSDAGVCLSTVTTSCSAASCDDGTPAVFPANGSLDCVYRQSGSTWSVAVTFCQSRGPGFRLPTKGEAIQIYANPSICRTPFTYGGWTWTSTCGGVDSAWMVNYVGSAGSYPVNGRSDICALCVR
jgi:hypothetical protein